jgi:hypothetical protein
MKGSSISYGISLLSKLGFKWLIALALKIEVASLL